MNQQLMLLQTCKKLINKKTPGMTGFSENSLNKKTEVAVVQGSVADD